jgi:hypothetical protein
MALFPIRISYQKTFCSLILILPCTIAAIYISHQRWISIGGSKPVDTTISTTQAHRIRQYLPHIHQPITVSIIRGIIIFYPHDQETSFLPELLWLYRSWIEMMKNEPPLWRTDLVIYTGNYTSNLQQLGCRYNRIRLHRDEPPECRVFIYERIRSRNIAKMNDNVTYTFQQRDVNRSILLATHLQNYEYIDAINTIAECYPSFSIYDYILRTDMDVFLTPSFGHFVPVNDTLLTGRGGYATQFNSARFRRISRDMNWSYANLTNIGSTW